MIPGRAARRGHTLLALTCVLALVASAPDDPASGARTKQVKGATKPQGPAKRPNPRRRPPREFFAIQSFAPMTAGELAAVGKARVGMHRIFLTWPAVEKSPGERDWRYYDRIFRTTAGHRIRILPVLYGTAGHLGNHSLQPPVGSDAARAGWAAFAADAVRRYGRGGEFWRLNPQLPYTPVTQWQVWNEQSSNSPWDGHPSARQYAGLVRDAALAVRSVDRNAEIVLGGILPHRGDPTGVAFRSYLRGIYRVRHIERHFDGIAIHPYTSSPPRVLELAADVHKLAERHRDGKARLWITELGWATGGSGQPNAITTPRRQARRLTRTYRGLIRHRRALRLDGVVWHVLRDAQVPGYSDYWALHTGLFTVDGSPKPAWPAFNRITGGEAAPIVEPPQQAPARPSPPPPPPSDPCFVIFC